MAKKAKPYRAPAGISESAVNTFIAEAEQLDRGTERFPWDAKLKATIKKQLQGLPDFPAMRATVNEIVVASKGGGLFGRGPFA